jgi:hypothetical protein
MLPGDATEPRKAEGEPFVFVSYTRVDEAWATWIASVLEIAGLAARVQVWDSPPGRDFVAWMNEQLAGARWTVAVYSKAYFASRWCTVEWTSALARQTLLPVRIEPVDPPPPLGTITWVDLYDLEEAEAREKLLRAVGLRVLPRLATFPGRAASSVTFPGSPPATAPSGSSNLVTGNVQGNVVQARDVRGGIVLGGDRPDRG